LKRDFNAENLRVCESDARPEECQLRQSRDRQKKWRAVERHPIVVESIKAWATANGYDALDGR
jgi:hypothetical protein